MRVIASLQGLFSTQAVRVEFRELQDYPIDFSLFDTSAYDSVRRDGLSCSPAQLILASSVHFKGRFGDGYGALRFLNACLEIVPSLSFTTGGWCLNGSETNEFQTKSSECIAVGLGLRLANQLFQVNFADISQIPHRRGKRCDFQFFRNGALYVLETRGRKHYGRLSSAIEEVFSKKANYSTAKYGFLSHLPRDGQPVSMIVVDPPSEPEPAPLWTVVHRRLLHYARAADLAGFYRLSLLLRERAERLDSDQAVERLNRQPLDYANVVKLGDSLTTTHGRFHFSSFFPGSIRLQPLLIIEQHVLVFGLNREILKLLEEQDYYALAKWRTENLSELKGEDHRFGSGVMLCQNDDGTALAAIPSEGLLR